MTSGSVSLPAFFVFRCEPYQGQPSREFALRLGVRTGDAAKPALSLTLRMVRAEQHAEDLAQLFANDVVVAVDDVPVYLGSYSAVSA